MAADRHRSDSPSRTTRIAPRLTVIDATGTRIALRPLANILRARTRATLAALRKAGNR